MVEMTSEHTRQMRTGNLVMSAGKGFPDKRGRITQKNENRDMLCALQKNHAMIKNNFPVQAIIFTKICRNASCEKPNQDFLPLNFNKILPTLKKQNASQI